MNRILIAKLNRNGDFLDVHVYAWDSMVNDDGSSYKLYRAMYNDTVRMNGVAVYVS